MRLLFLGDVMGRSGRVALAERLPGLRAAWNLDFVVVNGENATSGAGLSEAHARLLFEAGADCVTLGDHAFDRPEMLQAIESDPRILRPLNYAKTAPGRGARVFEVDGGRRVLVAQVLGQVFMKRPFDDPFSALDRVLAAHPRGGQVQAALIDVHCEATSEKMAVGHFCDGRASVVVGTHTHVPTADAMILPGGTAYLSDAGMCGPYDSVIGMDKAEPMRRFVTGMSKGRFEPAAGEATSEKMAVGHFCDGRASVVVGTHTHVPTADAMILPGGTAYLSDAGMCGPYDSVIGMDKAEPMRRFVTGMSKGRFEPAGGEATLCGLYVETDDVTGRATRVEAVRQGGALAQAGPAPAGAA